VAAGFHLLTFATIRIIFLPHLLCLAAFLPLERLGRPSPAAAAACRSRSGSATAGVHGAVTPPP
jgi:hypothetical protein